MGKGENSITLFYSDYNQLAHSMFIEPAVKKSQKCYDVIYEWSPR